MREHRLHAIAGFTFADDIGGETGMCVIGHGREVQGSWTSIRYKGRDGYQWWVLEAVDPEAPAPPDLLARARVLGKEFPFRFPSSWTAPNRRTSSAGCSATAVPGPVVQGPHRAVRRRSTCPSPYAAYGAGMSIEDGYFIGRALRGVDLPTSRPCDRPFRRTRTRANRT